MSGEDERLDEAMRKGDDLLLGSLKTEEKRRGRLKLAWVLAAIVVVALAVAGGMVLLEPSRQRETQGIQRQTVASSQAGLADAFKEVEQSYNSSTTTKTADSAGISGEAWERTLSSLTDDWRRAFAVGNELVELKPTTGWSILSANWKKIPSDSARQQVIKAFDFAHHPHLLDVLDLGMKDESPKVQAWAAGYLKAFAFEDFAEDSSKYPAWREETKGKSLDDATAQSAAAWVERAKSARGPDIEKAAKVVEDARSDLAKMKGAQDAMKAAGADKLALEWLIENPTNREISTGATSLIMATKPDEAFLRSKILPLLAKDQPMRLRESAVTILGRSGNKFAVEPLMEVLKSAVMDKKKELIWPTAQALAELGDVRAIPTMIAVIAADDTYDTVYGVGYFGLCEMTGVNYDEKHNGAWWKAWWEREKNRFPEPVRSMAVPEIAKAGEAKSDARREVRPIFAVTDGTEPPVEERTAPGDEQMKYLLIGPIGKSEPKAGYRLLLVLPGGDGSAEFRGFVSNMLPQALNEKYLVAELIAPKWDEKQQIVWPTEKVKAAKMNFSTEKFIDSVVEDVKGKHKVDEKYIFSLGWSSGGPAVYAEALREKSPITGAFVAMSVFKPGELPDAKNAKARAFYIFHSPQDFIQMRYPQNAKQVLTKAGAKVELVTYEGGHGWHGDIFGSIRNGVQWLEKNVSQKPATPATTQALQ
jgi:predicted esterase